MDTRTLIIVCDDDQRKHADFLAQLISLEDDSPESVVGVKDGSVAARVWSEKDYKNNSPTMSSNQHVVFIGNSKLIKEKRSHMMVKYDQYGMKYGWLGKQAVLSVDDVVGVEEYDAFFTYATGKQENVERLIEQKDLIPQERTEEEKRKGIPMALKKVPAMGLIAIKQLATNRRIEEQQYSCLTYVFYLNGLSEFLGL